MEDVLDLYEEEPDPQRPRVCFDEQPYQMLSHTREPLPAKPGQPQRYDYEYQREGSCNLFLFLCPEAGWREVKVTARRTAIDFGHCMKELVDVHYPDADVVRVVVDNLNTHTPASLYKAFAPEEARRILKKLEFHFTPKHGSWLNMAEIELSVLTRQCLARRLSSQESVRRETSAWVTERNTSRATVNWRFTSATARKKLQRLYPSPSER
jgi:hypothetical protein